MSRYFERLLRRMGGRGRTQRTTGIEVIDEQRTVASPPVDYSPAVPDLPATPAHEAAPQQPAQTSVPLATKTVMNVMKTPVATRLPAKSLPPRQEGLEPPNVRGSELPRPTPQARGPQPYIAEARLPQAHAPWERAQARVPHTRAAQSGVAPAPMARVQPLPPVPAAAERAGTEVRIGSVTIEVRAPAAPWREPAARFSLSRHYLRSE